MCLQICVCEHVYRDIEDFNNRDLGPGFSFVYKTNGDITNKN